LRTTAIEYSLMQWRVLVADLLTCIFIYVWSFQAMTLLTCLQKRTIIRWQRIAEARFRFQTSPCGIYW